MYSLEQRKRAFGPCIRYGLKATAAIRELGYPSRAQLASWHREWQESGGSRTAASSNPRWSRRGPRSGTASPMGEATPSPGASLDAPSARRSSPSGPASMHPAREGRRSPGRSMHPRRPLPPGAPERFQPVYVLMTRSAPRKRLKMICAVMRNVWPCITGHQV